MGGGRNLSREGEGCELSERGDAVRDGGPEDGAMSASGEGPSMFIVSSFMVNNRGSVEKDCFGEEVFALSSSELAVVTEEMDEAMEARREDLSRSAATLRLTLLGPRIFRSGAYSHWRPRLRHR